MQDFISSQLLNDEQWKKAIAEGFHLPYTEGKRAERLRLLLEEGMKEETVEIKSITDNPERPTFRNTIVALSECGKKLERVTTILYNLLEADTDEELDNLANEMTSRLSEHSNNIMLNVELFVRVKEIYTHPEEGLTDEDLMLLEKTYEGFERSGATLDEEGKRQFRKITAELSEKSLNFSQNLLKETNNFALHVISEKDLEGLPDIHKKAAAYEAKQGGLEGWFFTLHAPSFVPFMMYVDKRALREKMYLAYHTRCTHDDENNNFANVEDIVNLRRKKAQLLGYRHYADYALKRRMAQTPEAVYALLNELIANYLPQARKEVKAVEMKAKELEGEEFVLQPWDFAYYSQKLKKALFDFDPDMLRPYLELSQVVKGVLGLAGRLYGVQFEENKDVPVYHEDVQAYNIYDADHVFLAIIFLDFFPRESKRGGAWMTGFREEHACIASSEKVTPSNSFRPVVSVTMNFTKPVDDTPALLTLGEVETFLHEFGHALHGIFAMTHYASLSGTSVFWDFVELPSQIMENYATEPDFLNTFAKHYQTGELMPEKLVEVMRKCRNFQVGYACVRQVFFGLLDMAYYTLSEPFDTDIRKFEQKAWESVRLMPVVADACMSVQFSHIMSGGYAAGYYSYKWAEVLDADAFEYFKETGIFNRGTAEKFREYILSRGGTEHPHSLYLQFRGKEPTIKALMKRDGICKRVREDS